MEGCGHYRDICGNVERVAVPTVWRELQLADHEIIVKSNRAAAYVCMDNATKKWLLCILKVLFCEFTETLDCYYSQLHDGRFYPPKNYWRFWACIKRNSV